MVLGVKITSKKVPNINGAYIHIPFCRRRCYYCDFDVKIIGERESTRDKLTEDYINVLLNEIKAESRLSKTSQDYILSQNTELNSIYLGGGTPSLLSSSSINKILTTLNDEFGISNDAEITMEMDPGTFNKEKLLSYKNTGINRISLGIQSFDETMLQAAGRAHTAYESVNALIAAKDIFDNVSVDLISGLPNLTMDIWYDTLLKASQGGASHISVYDLQIEENTAFGRWYTPGVFPLPTEESSAQMYRLADQVLKEEGFEHYEVSNYARINRITTTDNDNNTDNYDSNCNSFRSQHNQKYWGCEEVWGFGMAAASLTRGKRVTRPKTISAYVDYVDKLQIHCHSNDSSTGSGSGSNMDAVLDISEGVDVYECVMLSLRTADGLDLPNLEHIYGRNIRTAVEDALHPYTQNSNDYNGEQPLVVLDREDSNNGDDNDGAWVRARLASPEGFIISNDVISSVFAALNEVEQGCRA